MKQLIILGNGFDLQCGLKSSYKDFFRSEILDTNGELFGIRQMKNNCSGFWEELLFSYYKTYGDDDYKWCVIEAIIKETLFLVNYGQQDLTSPDASKGLWRQALSFSERPSYMKEPPYNNDIIKKTVFDSCVKYLKKNNKHSGNTTSEDIRHLINIHLLQELKKLEKRFCEYIKQQIVNPENVKVLNEKYIVKASNMLIKLADFSDIPNSLITTDNIPSKDGKIYIFSEKVTKRFIDEVYILSFNYTALFDILCVKSPCIYSNVHGKICQKKCDGNCNSSIIFGIDDFIIQSRNIKDELKLLSETDDELRLFSKTYRRMINASTPQSVLPSKDSVTIKFYGHSLSEADYSYFQSIFDYYSLYGNRNVDIIFYNSKGHEQIDEIYRLVNTYGKTLINKEQGKNLMHKLLLENRIKIVEISLKEEDPLQFNIKN